MKLPELRKLINTYENKLKEFDKTELEMKLTNSVEAYPFNEYELRLMYLKDKSIISFNEYYAIRSEYIKTNKFLELYGLAPRIFGQIWGEQHILESDTRFSKAHKSLDPNFDGEYDVWLEGIKIEIKASRAIEKNTSVKLIMIWRILFVS